MQVQLIFFTLFLTTISDGFCGRLDKLQNDIKYACPYPEEILKCHCDIISGGINITCTGPMTDSELQSSLKTLQEYSLKEFTIRNYNATSISTDLWKGQKIESLYLHNVAVDDKSFMTKDKLQFQGLEDSLEHLYIDESFKSKYRPILNLQLDHLKKLKGAMFEGNNIPEVGNNWFTSGPQDLFFLSFSHNGIMELGDKAFTSLSGLGVLIVSDNQIFTVSRSMFPKSATKLWQLNLSNNKLNNLPNDIFSGMSSLKTVILKNNDIQTIDEETWKSVATQITLFSIKDNPLICDSEMKWICATKLFKRTFKEECNSPDDMKGLTLRNFCKKVKS